MDLDLKGRVAFVTGGGAGIGEAIAGALANELMTISDNKVTLISIRSSGQTEQAFLDLVEKEESRGFARAYRPEAA